MTYTPTTWADGQVLTAIRLNSLEQAMGESSWNPNPLYGRKWAVCGDSFTNGDFTTGVAPVIESGPYQGKPATYGWLIGNRNNMSIQHLALGGRTLAVPKDNSFTNCFGLIYQLIAEDADYCTLYFGINDSHHRSGSTGSDGEDQTGVIPLGEDTDKTVNTFTGAWNVILPWLLTNRPTTHVGILVSNGCETDDYRTVTIRAADRWGIPYLDLNGDQRCPMMIRSTNPAHSDQAKQIAMTKWRVSNTNTHPNKAAHEYESRFIETWLATI